MICTTRVDLKLFWFPGLDVAALQVKVRVFLITMKLYCGIKLEREKPGVHAGFVTRSTFMLRLHCSLPSYGTTVNIMPYLSYNV